MPPRSPAQVDKLERSMAAIREVMQQQSSAMAEQRLELGQAMQRQSTSLAEQSSALHRLVNKAFQQRDGVVSGGDELQH